MQIINPQLFEWSHSEKERNP